ALSTLRSATIFLSRSFSFSSALNFLASLVDMPPYEAILDDYLATNGYTESRTQEILDALAAYGMAGKLDDSVRVLNSADERFLRAALDAVDKRYGSLDAYVHEALCVTPEKQESLQAKFLAG
ncbi:MAG: tyrosine-protein phosphatase, partial [Raoultibacter sp.]